jgi:hypothetical protein
MREEVMNAYGILVGYLDGERSPSRPGRSWEVNAERFSKKRGAWVLTRLISLFYYSLS